MTIKLIALGLHREQNMQTNCLLYLKKYEKCLQNKKLFLIMLFSFVPSEICPDSPPPAFMVYAGLEPLSFTNLFPFWTVDENVREINLRVRNACSKLTVLYLFFFHFPNFILLPSCGYIFCSEYIS